MIQTKDQLTLEHIKEAEKWLEYYAITEGLYGLSGNWAIGNSGDIVSLSKKCNHYPIFAEKFFKEEKNLREHISHKTWFGEEQDTLSDAIDIARDLYVKTIKDQRNG